jgi:hypothetical protein
MAYGMAYASLPEYAGHLSCAFKQGQHVLCAYPCRTSWKYRILRFQYMFLACDFDENLNCSMIFIVETNNNTQQRRHPQH